VRDTLHLKGYGGWPPPPRLLVVLSIAVIGLATVLAVLGAIRTGVTTDEPIHVMRLRNYFETGWYALDWDYAGEGPGSDGTNTYVYAPVAMLLLHVWSVLWGVEGWHDVADSQYAYQVRHLGVVLVGLVGLTGVAAAGRVLLRSWRWGLVAAAILAATPMWTGHTMFNVKDVPVATGHVLCTLGLLLFVRDRPAAWRLRVARALVLSAGLVLTLGTRPGMWSGLTVLVAVGVVGTIFALPTRRDVLTGLAEMAGSLTVAAAALVALYPRLFASPLTALPRTSESSSSFLEGHRTDRWYVPRHLAQEMPSLLLVFALTGTVVAMVVMLRHPRSQWVVAARLALVGAQAFTLPVVAVLIGSDLYHGLRQLLFAVPALALLAACGMAWWLARPRVGVRRLVPAVAGLALVLPMVDQVTLQPYQTSYVNLATDLLYARGEAPDSRPGGDFWRVSIPELVDGVDLDRLTVCKAIVVPETDIAYPFTNAGGAFSTSRSLDCREEATGPLAPSAMTVVRRPPVTDFDAVFIGALPRNCTEVDDVSRRRHGFDVVLTTLGRCTIKPQPLDLPGVRIDDPALGTALPGDMWLYATDGWLQWPEEPELRSPVPMAGLAFRADHDCRRAGCTLAIGGGGPDDLVAMVDGTAVEPDNGSGVVRLPISATQAKGGVWVTLARRSGAALDVRMTGLWVEPAMHTTRRGRA
jgi:hypothetical protein